MELLLSFAEKFFEFVALSLYVIFWCFVGGVGCWLVYVMLRELRCYFQRQAERESIDAWHKRNQLIAGAVSDLDHPDELQRTLAEGFINTLLP